MSNHTPIQPHPEVLSWITGNCSIHPEQGVVVGPKGTLLGTNTEGYVFIRVCLGKLVRRAHLIWWAHYGYWPKLTTDHINGDSTDDRIDNLREATMREQIMNQRSR